MGWLRRPGWDAEAKRRCQRRGVKRRSVGSAAKACGSKASKPSTVWTFGGSVKRWRRVAQGSRPTALQVSMRPYRWAEALTAATEQLKSQFFRLCKALHKRKNWLFAGSERAAAIQSLFATAKLNGIEPAAWLKDTLEKLPIWPNSRIDELLPLRENAQAVSN